MLPITNLTRGIFVLISVTLLAAGVFMVSPLYAGKQSIQTICRYSPATGIPNSLGMRAFITVSSTDEGVEFVYEQFPSPLDDQPPVSIALRRSLVMYDVDIQQARRLMRENNRYYEALIGSPDPEGFAAYDKSMQCESSPLKH